MSENQKKVLQMVAEGKVSVEEGERLLSLLANEKPENPPAAASPATENATEAAPGRTDFTGFKRLDVSAAVEVDVAQGKEWAVEIAPGDRRDLRVTQEGETLKIRRPSYFGFGWWGTWGGRPHVRITMPDLEMVTLHGASGGVVSGFQSDRELRLNVQGASHLKMTGITAGSFHTNLVGASGIKGDIKVSGEARLYLTGASTVKISGAAERVVLNLSGASNVRMGDFTVNSADVSCVGASGGEIAVKETLDVSLVGVSNLTYTGNPKIGKKMIVDMSNLHHG